MQPRLFNFHGQQVRTMIINDDPYFMGRDITNVLQYSNGPKAIRDHVDEEDKTVNETFTVNGTSPVLINESGLYSLILSSKLPTAREFKHWVTSEVIPAIRKHGAYMTDEKAFNVIHNANGLADLLQQAADQLKAKNVQIAEMKPKALFADAVATSDSSILVGQLAKILKQNGIEIGQNRLFRWLRNHGYLGKRGESYNRPTQKGMSLGLFEVKERTVNNPDGSVRVTLTTKVTGKGQQYFINKFLNEEGMEYVEAK